MAATVVEATVRERREAAPGGCFLLRLECPEVARRAQPGQFVMVRWARNWPHLLSRPFSVADVGGGGEAPEWFDLLIQVRRAGTRTLTEVRPGDRLRVTGPLGFGFTVVRGASAHILIAGGVGAAPFPLLARRIAQDEEARAVPLYYLMGAPGRERLFFLDRLAERGARVLTATEDGSAGVQGSVMDLLPMVEEELGGLEGSALYAAGPQGLLRACAELARERGLQCQLSMEARMGCGMGLCQGCVVKVRDARGEGWRYRRVCYEGPVMRAEEVLFD